MQGIYTHIPETNYFPREYGVAAILFVLFMVFISLVSVFNLFIIIIIIISIIIIIIIISFMQGIYTYIPDTNYVPRKYSVAAILLLLFIVLISLVSMLNLFIIITIIINWGSLVLWPVLLSTPEYGLFTKCLLGVASRKCREYSKLIWSGAISLFFKWVNFITEEYPRNGTRV